MTEQLFDLVVVDYPSSKNIDALVQSIMQMLGEQSPRLEFKLSEALLFNNGMTSIREGLTESEAEDLRKNLAMLGIDCDLRPTLQLVAKDSEEEQDVALYTCPACGHIQPKVKENNKNLSISMEAYMLLGKHQEDKELLKFVAEILSGRPTSDKAELGFITGTIHKLIQTNPKTFVELLKDPYIHTKVLIQKCIENNIIRKKGDYLYLSSTNEPLCGPGEDPTLSVAAKYLNIPKNQELKFTLEAKLKTM